MKYGFELEAFVVDRAEKPVLVPPGVPFDECGWLLEIRSEPHSDIDMAIALFKVEKDRVIQKTLSQGVYPSFVPLMIIPRDMKVEANRRYSKGRIQYQNIYGFQTHRCPTKFQTASLHISFTNEQKFDYYDNKGQHYVKTYPGFVDHAKLIVGLDKAFKQEIKAAKRNPGFYEVKYDGRIEYRSLPNTVDMNKVAEVLRKLL